MAIRASTKMPPNARKFSRFFIIDVLMHYILKAYIHTKGKGTRAEICIPTVNTVR